MKKTFLFLAALAMSAMMWAGEVSLTNAQILAAGDAANGYSEWNITDGSGNVWSAYAIKNKHSNATSGYHYLQIKKYNSNVAYYIHIPEMSGTITSITMTVSSASKPMDGGDNAATLFFSSSNSTSEAGDGVASGTGTSSVTINTSDLNLTSGYITASGGVRIWDVTVTYGGTPTPATLDSLVIKGKAEKMEYEVGEAFDPAGLEVWGIYTKTVKHDSTSQIKSGFEWSIDPETFAEISDNASVTLSASYKDLTTADTIITGIKVSEPAPLPKYATIYTSNVELTAGENSDAAGIIYDGETYNGVKCGSSSKAGSCTTTIPAATKTLHFHAIGWKGAAETTLTVNGTEYTITPDDGMANNSPFTLVGDAYEYYYTFDPQGATEITFASSKRFVIFGVNAELPEGFVAAPKFEPTATDFDQEVMVTLTCETEGAEIFYALNEEVTSMNAIKYTEPIKLTETTTIYAAAKKDGKESEHVSKTYTKILEEITENFTPDLTKAVGLNEQTTAAVNEGVLTVIAASEPWAAAGVKIPFDGYVKTTNFAGIKASAKVPTGGIEVCAYVIDQDGKRWYQESMNSTTYADWASFAHTTVPFVTLWDGGTAEDWANAELVAFGFYGASGDGLVDFEINLKDVEILVGEQPVGALNYISARKKAAKQLIKGQIMIIREGKVYNMLGF